MLQAPSRLVSWLSQAFTLEPGIVSPPAPAGVGAHRTPPVFLQSGTRTRSKSNISAACGIIFNRAELARQIAVFPRVKGIILSHAPNRTRCEILHNQRRVGHRWRIEWWWEEAYRAQKQCCRPGQMGCPRVFVVGFCLPSHNASHPNAIIKRLPSCHPCSRTPEPRKNTVTVSKTERYLAPNKPKRKHADYQNNVRG